MYEYVDDKEFVSKMRNLCGNIMQDLCHTLKTEYNIGANFFLVGSGARRLITQNASQPVDLDYNLKIVKCDNIKDCRGIKEKVQKAFNIVLEDYELDDCHDSTSSLTSGLIYFTEGNHTEFSMDVCIIKTNANGNYSRLIHEKHGCWSLDQYYWCEAKNSGNLPKKISAIKHYGYWDDVREQYRDIKNMYLRSGDHDHPSFICYIEAVNNVYNSL